MLQARRLDLFRSLLAFAEDLLGLAVPLSARLKSKLCELDGTCDTIISE